MKPRYVAVLPAAGVGARMRAEIPKQYLQVAGKTVLEHTLQRLLSEPRIAHIVLVVSPQDTRWQDIALLRDSRLSVVSGGEQRADSVRLGLRSLEASCAASDWVLVHDVARPCLRRCDMQRLMDSLADDEVGGLLAVPASDTLKASDPQSRVAATLDRSVIWQAQTPQMFRFGLLLQALQSGYDRGLAITDEASAIEALGYAPRLVAGSRDNIKITCPEDLALADYYLKQIAPEQ